MVVAVCTRLNSHSILEHSVLYVHSCALCALCALKDTILSIVHRSAQLCMFSHYILNRVYQSAPLCTLAWGECRKLEMGKSQQPAIGLG